MSEYDPLIRRPDELGSDDLEHVQLHFEKASRGYLASPIPWLVWAIVLPGAALLTPAAVDSGDALGALFLWSGAVLLGGAVEGAVILRRGRRRSTPLGAWAMRVQGNQSLVGLALSALLVWRGHAMALPGLWLLLIGHSFFVLGGLAFRPMRQAGVIYQVGGAASLLPALPALPIFAIATALGNLRIAIALLRRSRRAGVPVGRR